MHTCILPGKAVLEMTYNVLPQIQGVSRWHCALYKLKLNLLTLNPTHSVTLFALVVSN